MPLPTKVPSFERGFRMPPGEQLQALADSDGSVKAAITALAGGAQSALTPTLDSYINEVTTVASGNDSVMLPASYAGASLIVRNAGANSLQVFGNFAAAAETCTINGTAGSTGIAVASNKTVMFICPVAGKWYSLLTA